MTTLEQPSVDGFRPEMARTPPRLAILCDFREEGWPSMDLFADMLLAELKGPIDRVTATEVRPPYRRRFTRLPWLGSRRLAINADRLLNRFHDYPHYVRRQRQACNLFHLCDHSYAHLVHELPSERTGVFCHDLDTFRCVLEPHKDPRPHWFRAMSRRILDGLRRAALVFHTTTGVREELLHHGLVDPERLVWAPPGVAAEFQPATEDNASLPAVLAGRHYILNVGSCIPRKRIDLLLHIFAAVRRQRSDLLLVQIGGEWTREQREQLEQLDLGPAVIQKRGLSRYELAALYRGARLVVQPSEAEGFGLPLIEALACGAVVVASDIPVFREVGGDALVHCPVADVAYWADTIGSLLDGRIDPPTRSVRLDRARRFSWQAHAHTLVDHYQGLLATAAQRIS
jgi:glycosyltransferase involved in cell wall biosynthesis